MDSQGEAESGRRWTAHSAEREKGAEDTSFPYRVGCGGVPRTHSLPAQNSEAPQDHMGIVLGKVLMRNRIIYLSSFSPHPPPSHLSNLSVLRNGLT